MWNYEKRLEYPVNITTPNAKIAQIIMSQYGGPDGEIGASMRYLSQRFTAPNRTCMGILNDIGREAPEMFHCKGRHEFHFSKLGSHLMFLFILDGLIGGTLSLEFKYISCSYLSHVFKPFFNLIYLFSPLNSSVSQNFTSRLSFFLLNQLYLVLTCINTPLFRLRQ